MLQRNVIYTWVRFLMILAFVICLVWLNGSQMTDYMFAIFAHTGFVFSFLLGAMFVVGAYVVVDRIAFFMFHLLLSRRLVRNTPREDKQNVFTIFLRAAREFRATSAEGVYSDEIVDRAREVALRDTVDGQEIDRGRSRLEFLGTIAPIVGFMGTLVGLIDSFRELGLGGELTDVLRGLALSMTTSLLGAIISVVFLSAAWILGQARQSFDAELYRRIATAQETDR